MWCCAWHSLSCSSPDFLPMAGEQKAGISSATSTIPGLQEHPAGPCSLTLLLTVAPIVKMTWLLNHNQWFLQFFTFAPGGRCLLSQWGSAVLQWAGAPCAACVKKPLSNIHCNFGKISGNCASPGEFTCSACPRPGPHPSEGWGHVLSELHGLWISTGAVPETFPWQCSRWSRGDYSPAQ